MKVAQLRDELANRGLDTQGKKPQLLERLLAALGHRRSAPDDEEAEQITDVLVQEVRSTSVEEEVEIDQALSDAPLDPERTYVVRVRSAPSGQRRVVEGIGIGMTLLEVNPNNPHNPAMLQTNQLLLPGKRSPFEADYCALIMAMRYTRSRGVQHLILETDEPHIVTQMKGQGRVGPGSNQELNQKALELKKSFQSFDIRHCSTSTPRGTPPPETEILAKTALAKQRHLESDWQMVDPMSGAQSTSTQETSFPHINPDMQYMLQFDGGARGNPVGHAGAGMVVFDQYQEEIWCGWKYLGEGQSNNMAEYHSLIEGLEAAQKIGIKKIRAEGDSELVVKQVLGIYKVRKEWLKPLHQKVKELSKGFDSFEIESVPRAMNKRADFLANHAMDVRTSNSANDLLQ